MSFLMWRFWEDGLGLDGSKIESNSSDNTLWSYIETVLVSRNFEEKQMNLEIIKNSSELYSRLKVF